MLEKYYYDFHIHSCLSPCADDDMTPNNIAGMASIKKLQVIALTDHNSCKNCPAFFSACQKYGIVPIAGAEVTTSEDIHIICLFPSLDAAMAFDEALYRYKVFFKNCEETFGSQLIMNSEDEVVAHEKALLVNATMLDINSLYDFAGEFGALVYPAHIDRESNGIVSILGTLPDFPDYSAYEFHDFGKFNDYAAKFDVLNYKKTLSSSDAHYLWNINEAINAFEFDIDNCNPNLLRKKIFDYLSGK